MKNDDPKTKIRPASEKPSRRGFDSNSGFDRTRRHGFGGEDRPARRFDDRGARPPRRYNEDRPYRSNSSNDRFNDRQRTDRYRDESRERFGDHFNQRPQERSWDRPRPRPQWNDEDRPRRSFDRDDHAPRRMGWGEERDKRPRSRFDGDQGPARRPYGNRPSGGSYGRPSNDRYARNGRDSDRRNDNRGFDKPQRGIEKRGQLREQPEEQIQKDELWVEDGFEGSFEKLFGEVNEIRSEKREINRVYEEKAQQKKVAKNKGDSKGDGFDIELDASNFESDLTPALDQPSQEHQNPDDSPVRLSKLMTERGFCSRREADELIEQGWVRVNGEIVSQLGSRVPRDAQIELLPGAKSALGKRMTILLNKPIGYVSGQPEDGYEPAVRLIRPENQVREQNDSLLAVSHLEGLAPAGRLDIDSQGLLVLTQNGTLAKLLIGEDSKIEKEYIVRVEGRLSDRDLQRLNHGLELDGRPLKPAFVEWLNEDQLRFVLKEGRKRQIRRMCEAVGLRVTGLKRVRVGQVRLGSLPEGQWRFLRPDEKF